MILFEYICMNILFFCFDVWNTYVDFSFDFSWMPSGTLLLESVGYRVRAWFETRFEILC